MLLAFRMNIYAKELIPNVVSALKAVTKSSWTTESIRAVATFLASTAPNGKEKRRKCQRNRHAGLIYLPLKALARLRFIQLSSDLDFLDQIVSRYPPPNQPIGHPTQASSLTRKHTAKPPIPLQRQPICATLLWRCFMISFARQETKITSTSSRSLSPTNGRYSSLPPKQILIPWYWHQES